MECEQPITGTGLVSWGDSSPSVRKWHANRIAKEEKGRQDEAEKYVRLDVQDGHVTISGKSVPVPCSGPVFRAAGSDDHLIKEYTEQHLAALEEALRGNEAARTWVRKQAALGARGPVVLAYRLTGLGQIILSSCFDYKGHWAVAYASHVFRPSVTVLLRAMKRYAHRIVLEAAGVNGVFHSPELARLLDLFVRFVRRVFLSWRFINEESSYRKQAEDNFNSARKLIISLAEQHSRLLVLRIDLYYKPYYKHCEADRHVHNFLRWLRGGKCKKELLPGYLGFIIKRENGLVRGMHWHLMVICDGNTQRNGGYLSQALGEEWARRTGQGPGCYNNCYVDRPKYQYDGLGVLELDDWVKMIGLRIAIHYLSKQDCVLKVSGGKVKNFWRSPTGSSGKKRGRPRFAPESLKLLKRMLGGKRSRYPSGIDL